MIGVLSTAWMAVRGWFSGLSTQTIVAAGAALLAGALAFAVYKAGHAAAEADTLRALAANNAAMTYYNYMLRLRQMGYTGPSLPTGVTPQSLQNSINAANQARKRCSVSLVNGSPALRRSRGPKIASPNAAAAIR